MRPTDGSHFVFSKYQTGKNILSLFVRRALHNVSFLLCHNYFCVIYFIEKCFSVKQSRQKNLSPSEQKVFVFFAVARLDSLDCCCLTFS